MPHARQGEDHADCLRQLGIPVAFDENGWFTSEAVTVARAALAIVADPADSFAAALYLTHGPAALPLEDMLTAALDEVLADHETLAPLIALHTQTPGRTASRMLAALRTGAGLDEWAAGLDDPARAHADLARLDAEAIAFEAADPLPAPPRACSAGTSAPFSLGSQFAPRLGTTPVRVPMALPRTE
ncbi:hypothetical protein [Palleronia abyssalis]|uniref:Uncharacterized protein n=1 Tax=Palleronia abyssalis TaxID=1501240 RepID=A0A2R8BPV9_9RHOB|nr:hypothetical protein [Palleronia abyssalis]SPJ22219.1 hypothetical protein PAA8504_00006 [Palleronia abyssalis]